MSKGWQQLLRRTPISRRLHFSILNSINMDSCSTSPSSSVAQRCSYNPTIRWNPEVEEYFINAYGADHFARISYSLTRPSCYSCIRVNFLKSTTDAVMEKLTRLLQEAGIVNGFDCMSIEKQVSGGYENDERLRKERCHGLPEGAPQSGGKLVELLEGPSISKSQFPRLDYVLLVKGSGPHNIQYGNQPDQSVKEVIVSRKCAEAVLRGAQIFVPGLLACSSHVEKGDIVAVSVAVEQPSVDGGWSVGFTRGTVLQGSQADPQYLERNVMYIGKGIAQFSRAGMFRALEGIAVEMTNRVYRLPSFHDLLEGEIFLQNLPSIVAAHILEPQQGERVLDMCAAPGGKTTAIAMLMRDKGEVVAIDRSHNKVMEIKKLAAEMGLNCIRAYRLDALKSVCQTSGATVATNLKCARLDVTPENSSSILIDSDMLSANMDKNKSDVFSSSGNGRYDSKDELRKFTQRLRNGPGRNHSMGGRAENSKGFMPNSFDRVLLDAPCSALGLRPRLFAAEESIKSLHIHAKYQRKMFDQAVQLVRTGGVIVYSTTSHSGQTFSVVELEHHVGKSNLLLRGVIVEGERILQGA